MGLLDVGHVWFGTCSAGGVTSFGGGDGGGDGGNSVDGVDGVDIAVLVEKLLKEEQHTWHDLWRKWREESSTR